MDSNIVTLNPSELIKWCKVRKKELELSNADIAEKTGVPVGTIDRILSGNYSEFKYSSIQPVISLLLGFNKDTPQPDDSDSEQAQYYYQTIEGYKLVLENKNHEIQQLKLNLDRLSKDIEFLREENVRKAEFLQKEHDLLVHLEETLDVLVRNGR